MPSCNGQSASYVTQPQKQLKFSDYYRVQRNHKSIREFAFNFPFPLYLASVVKRSTYIDLFSITAEEVLSSGQGSPDLERPRSRALTGAAIRDLEAPYSTYAEHGGPSGH